MNLSDEDKIKIQLSKDITFLHIKNQFILKYSESLSRKILNLFYQAFYMSPNLLEKVKTSVSSEEHDLKDLTDLLDDLHPVVRRELVMLFMMNYSLSNKYLYHTQVITDLDCTLFENSNISPCVYGGNRSPVAGIFPLIKALTRNGESCLTVVTARPSSIEIHSLISNRKRLFDLGIPRYSFQSGELDGTLHFIANQSLRKINAHQKANRELKMASILFAILKFKCYLRLKEAYPFSQFVFTGDDAQGDYIFASLLVNDNPNNFAFIRKTASDGLSITPCDINLWPSEEELLKYIKIKIPDFKNNCGLLSLQISRRVLYVHNFYEAIVKAPVDVLDENLKSFAKSESIKEYETTRHIKNYPPEDLFWLNFFINGNK